MFRRRNKSTPTPTLAGTRATAPAGAFGQETQDPPASAVVTIDDDNFFDMTAGGYTVVDFWAPWCAPCRAFAPVFGETAREHSDKVRFGSCNVDENPMARSLLAIRGIPTLVVFGPDGSEVGRHVGLLPQRSLVQLVERLATS